MIQAMRYACLACRGHSARILKVSREVFCPNWMCPLRLPSSDPLPRHVHHPRRSGLEPNDDSGYVV